ncbi:hypothetical protein PYW08_011117 [Mythimna loreyi]|uniref:Uncharacterized protein n=1 Tax=Mythimna loreyi TaxID=667449 RepID=A0ACC2Q305_9NEOP|nr:hypothetical protein PYW08_011117 [Mythimna loreyi]
MIKTLLFLTGLTLVHARSNEDAKFIDARKFEPNENCPKEEVHFLLPHEYDCTKFYYCEYGMKYIEASSCAAGTEFDPEEQVCVHAASSGCTLPGPGPTNATTSGTTTVRTTTTTVVGITIPDTVPTSGTTAASPSTPGNPDDCETLANGCPADFSIHKLLPHEKYCHLFYNCDNGELVLQSCPEPLYFDPRLGCTWSWAVDCVNDGPYTYPTTAAPENATTPGDIGDVLDNGCPADFEIQYLLPHEECEKYYQCDNGKKIELDCQPGTVFNFPAQYCDWPFNVPNCAGSPGATARPTVAPDSEEIPLPNDPNDWEALPNGCPADFEIDHLLPHESDCGKYYACANGGLVEMACPPRLHFSPALQLCTWPLAAGCEQWECVPGDNDGCTETTDDNISTIPSTSTTVGAAESSEELPNPDDSNDSTDVPGEWEALPNGCPADFEIHHLLPHEYDCEKFYYCANGEKVEFSCAPNGTHFSPTLQRCTWPEEAGCELGDSTGTPLDTTTTPAPEDTPTPTTPAPDQSGENPGPWEALPNGCPADFEIHHLLPHESDCEKFYYCSYGEKIEFSCAPVGTHFSPTQQRCLWPEEAGCEHWDPTATVPDITTTPVPEDITTTTSSSVDDITDTTPSTTTTTLDPDCPDCPVDPEDICKESCNIAPWPHPECDKFYFCIGDQARLGVCAEGLHFNPTTLSCDFICNAGCVRNIPQITRHVDGLLMFVPNAWGKTGDVLDRIERELNTEL